jgi:pimeloyl-ACP methyl ester carboxylesterase
VIPVDAQPKEATLPTRSRWFGENGNRIYVRDYPGEGNTILLMHGFPDNLHLYDRVVPHLIPTRRVVTFDFLGWGESDKPVSYRTTARNQLESASLGLIQAELAGDAAAFRDAVSRLPFGLRLNERAWDAFARYAFVEYSLLSP